jgi:Bacteriocin-protection, YdeI or OmpD-Associated/Domain of unknown function (DUF1905)
MEAVVFTTVIDRFPSSPLWGWHFLVPPDIAAAFVQGNDRRVVCTINNQLTIHCALMPNKETWFVMLNQGVQKKLKAPLHSDLNISMVKDTSEYGMPMPDEFREVLDQDDDASTYFHQLTPGKQRSLIYIVSKVKNTDSKIRKSLAIADHLTANKGKLDYKLLNEALKDYNKM